MEEWSGHCGEVWQYFASLVKRAPKSAGLFQEIPKLLSGQEKLAADVAVVEWIIVTARPLTVSQHKKFRKMMEACSAGRYHGPCYQTVLGLTMQLSENGKDAASTFLNRLMTDGTKSVWRLPVLL